MAYERAFLDTHVAYWLASGRKSISPMVVRPLNTFENRTVSALSIVELLMKGKKLDGAAERLESIFNRVGFEVEAFAPVAAANFDRFGALDGHDPFDRMLLAQAGAVQGTTFFTADRVILSLGLDWVIDARG